MSQAVTVPRYTLADYLAMEPDGDVRHEFINGEIFAMVGASLAHGVIVMNLGAAIRPHLRGTPCRVVANDRKVLVAVANRVYYPDLLVRCATDHDDAPDAYTETQPTLIIEVLSPSTAAIDRRQKRLDYQQLASLKDYVLVAQDERLVEVYSRHGETWTVTTYRGDESVVLPSIDVTLPLAIIYEDVSLDSDNSA